MNSGHPHRRRGVAMILVVIAVGIAVLLGLTFITVQSTATGVARNIESHTPARMIAESGLGVAIALVRQADGDWRQRYGEGTWVADHAYGGGRFTLLAEADDEEDGGLFGEGDGEGDAVLLTAIGEYRGVTHVVRARMVATPLPGVPPGLEGREELPPGLRQRYEEGKPPPGLIGRGEHDYEVRWIERP